MSYLYSVSPNPKLPQTNAYPAVSPSRVALTGLPPEGTCLASVYSKDLINPFLLPRIRLKLFSILGGNNKTKNKKTKNRYQNPEFEQNNKMACPHHPQTVLGFIPSGILWVASNIQNPLSKGLPRIPASTTDGWSHLTSILELPVRIQAWSKTTGLSSFQGKQTVAEL